MIRQQFEMQRIRKAPQQDASKSAPRRGKRFGVACQLLGSRCDDAEKVTAQSVRLFFIPGKSFCNFCLCRGFKTHGPVHK